MKAAIVYPGGSIKYETVADPTIKSSTDAIIKVTLEDIITHRLPLSDMEHTYHIFRHKEEDCVKVVLNPQGRT